MFILVNLSEPISANWFLCEIPPYFFFIISIPCSRFLTSRKATRENMVLCKEIAHILKVNNLARINVNNQVENSLLGISNHKNNIL